MKGKGFRRKRSFFKSTAKAKKGKKKGKENARKL